jgi:translocation and assembly module TamB
LKLRRRPLALAAGAAIVAGVALAIGPGAAPLVDAVADGQRVWRLGRIDVDGVSGAWLGALRAERVTIADESGVWLEARDAALDWRPFDIFTRGVHLDRAHVARVDLLRQPELTARRPPRGGGMDVNIAALNIDEVRIAEAAFGEAGVFEAALKLEVNDQTLRLIDLTLNRTNSEADRLHAFYRQNFALDVSLLGEPGGVFAHALGAADQQVRAAASGQGNDERGVARASASIGKQSLLNAIARWTPADWNLQADAELARVPQLRTIARRIGSPLALNASGARVGRFSARAETPFMAVDLSGMLERDFVLEGPARFVATTDQLSLIARESPFTLGPARLEGDIRRNEAATAIRATLDAPRIEALGRVVRFTGPVEASLTNRAFTLSADLRAPDNAPALFAAGRLTTDLSWDRTRTRFALQSAKLESAALEIEAQGWVNGGDGEFSGDWRVKRLGALFGDITGGAAGSWRAFAAAANESRVWTTTVGGAGINVAGAPAIIPQLLGRTPQLDALLRYENRGVTISHARINGARLRAAATGRIVSGEADLALEASARGPLDLGNAQIAGAVDATGRLSGRIARPTLTANAAMSSFSASGVLVSEPVVDFTLAPVANGYSGRANVRGAVSGQPLVASSEVGIVGGTLSLPTLEANIGQMQARGSASIGARVGANLRFDGALDGLVPGLTGRVDGALAYSAQALTLDAEIVNARAGDLRIRVARLRAEGPPQAIAARYDLSGRLREAPLSFAGTGTMATREGVTDLALSGAGELASVRFATRSPMSARFANDSVSAALDVTLGDGALRVQWQERGRALNGSAQIEDAPLAPLAAIWGERAVGRIDGDLRLASSGAGLSGAVNLMFDDARFAGRQRGTLDLAIVGELAPTRLTATVNATSSDGLAARLEAEAPVTTSAAPLRIALVPERRGFARWSVRGPAESLWAAARLPDQNLQGALDGEGELQFGAGYLAGDGFIEIANGRFEDKLSAVTLTDLNARVAISETGIVIERFTASGPRGGSIVATGGSANPREGRIAVRVSDLRIVNRPDARATASGDLTLAWEGLHSTLSGALDVTEAEIDVASNPEAGIPTLDVVEINRPGQSDDVLAETPAAQRNGATALSVRIRAPGRVFTRGRGLEAEWSLDLRLEGTAKNPRLYGEARAIRGTLALSGQPFEIETARIIFDGDPLDADIDLTAQRDTADLTARVRLTGTARDPEIAFSSDPGLPEDEILPQVLFGRSVEDLSPFEAAQLAASLAALSGRASLDLLDAARAAAGLDRFNVREDEDGGFLVAGGVYLTRDVYVEVARTGLGQARTQVEWTVRPRLVLITSFLGNGDQRVSLRWRRESD